MKLKTILIFFTVALVSACGPAKRLTKSNVAPPSGDSIVTEEIILFPASDPKTVGRARAWSERTAEAEAGKSAGTTTVKPVKKAYPVITFTPDQSKYLQIRGINPLPNGGILELDLTEMSDYFCYPHVGKLISPYGRRGNSIHTGLDIKAQLGDTIRAAFPGVVRMAKVYSGYGNMVVVRHYEGFETVYAHCSKMLVDVNDVVQQGDPVALAGRTGRATTEHLHFEVRAGDSHIDPSKLLETDGCSLREGKLYLRYWNGKLVAYTSEDELQRYTADASQSSGAVKPEVNVRTGASPEAADAAVYYNVKKGDTLTAIAGKNKTTVARICQLNNIKSTSVLQINQRLRVK